MKFFKDNFAQFIRLIKMPEVITIIALCVNLILLILLTHIYNPYIYPEFYYIKIFLVFNSFFFAEFIYLIFSQYTVKTAFMYSLTSNYLICSLYYIANDRLDKFRINPFININYIHKKLMNF